MHILLRTSFVVLFTVNVLAHGHHDELTEEETAAPVDNILWIHILLQSLVWGVIFPIGMVLGLSRSRWHVPLQVSVPFQRTCAKHPAHRCPSSYVNMQVTGYALTVGGYILGHSHKGRAFLAGVHGKFANILVIPILAQLAIGIYLKLHINEKSIRPYIVTLHGIIGKAYPIFGWAQILFGFIAFRGYCRGGALGELNL